MQPTQEVSELDPDYGEKVKEEVEILFATIIGAVRRLEDNDDIVHRQLAMGLYHQFWRLREVLEPLID